MKYLVSQAGPSTLHVTNIALSTFFCVYYVPCHFLDSLPRLPKPSHWSILLVMPQICIRQAKDLSRQKS